MTQVALSSPASRYSYGLDHLLQEGGEPCEKVRFADSPPPDVRAPTISEVFFSYLKDASGIKNMIFKNISILSAWVFTIMPTLEEANTLSSSTRDAKNWLTLGEIPEKTVNMLGAGADLYNQPGVGKFAALANKVGLLTTSAIDVLTVASDKIRPMSAAASQTVKDVFGGALVYTTSYGIIEELGKIWNRAHLSLPEAPHLRDRVIAAHNALDKQSWLKNAMCVSYGALGVLYCAARLSLMTVAPWVKLALATSGLGFTILSHFQKKLEAEPHEAVLKALELKAVQV